MIKWTLALSVLLVVFVNQDRQLIAQSTTVQTSATVLQSLSVEGTDLKFRDIYPGIEKTVDYSDAHAALFSISGEPGKEISADFTLPSSMAHDGGSIQSVSILFGTSSSAHNMINNVSEATVYDPNSTLIAELDPTGGELYIWLGGKVDPTIIQEKGDYSAEIVLEISYTGN